MNKTIYIHDESNPEPYKHNYYKKIQELIKQGKLDEHNLNHIQIYHDSWCALINHDGFCNCDPDIQLDIEIIN